MKKLVMILAILSLLIVGCSTEVIEEEPTVEEQIDEAQAVLEEVMEESEEVEIKDVTEELVEEEIVEEPVVELEEEIIEEEVEEVMGTTHIIQVKVDGFDPNTITIKAGDTIQWENARSGNLNKVLIAGSSPCTKAKSAILMPGETYSWTFEEPVKCSFTDAISITQVMKVVVE